MVASSRLTRAAPPAPRPGSVRQANLVWPRRCLLDPHRAAEAGQRSLGNDADAPRLAGRLRVRAAGRGPADSGALRARRGSHSDEIPVRVQRHQPASAFLLPSQIETEGGGREVGEKKKADQKGREEKPRRCSGLTPSSLLLHSPEARRSGPPPRRDPALRLRAGRASRLFFSSRPLLRPGSLGAAVGASLRRWGRAEPAGPGCRPQRPAILGSWPPLRSGSGRARSRVLSVFSLTIFFFSWWDFFFFPLRGGLLASLKLGERDGRKCQVLISLHLCSSHPGPSPKKKKKLELEEVCRKASACGPRLLPRRRVRGGPAPVASSVRPFACPQLLN